MGVGWTTTTMRAMMCTWDLASVQGENEGRSASCIIEVVVLVVVVVGVVVQVVGGRVAIWWTRNSGGEGPG